jgi:hypothetical protein
MEILHNARVSNILAGKLNCVPRACLHDHMAHRIKLFDDVSLGLLPAKYKYNIRMNSKTKRYLKYIYIEVQNQNFNKSQP